MRVRDFIYYSFRFVIYHQMNNSDIGLNIENYRNLLFDDYDSDSEGGEGGEGGEGVEGVEGGEGGLDTQWITDYETQLMYDEYRLFLKTDVTRLTFEFYYLDRHKSCVERIVSMKYSLRTPNQITQNELFSMIRSYQRVDKKYYNFHALLFYSFDFQDNNGKELSQYLRCGSRGSGRFIEYTNLLSIDTIYIPPVLTMFHDVIGFSVLLYED